jgi:peptidoglycan/LPS O-acetylase OafA/YrhL
MRKRPWVLERSLRADSAETGVSLGEVAAPYCWCMADSSHPPRTVRIASVDSLRALALLAVFAFHTWEFADYPEIPVVTFFVGQNVRPDFFVVLTGFVLYLPFARDESRLDRFRTRPYFVRRLRRIVPPYWAALAYAILLPQVLVILARVAGQPASWQPWPSLGDLLAHLTFTQMFFEEYWSSINGSLWTMSLEMQLYVLFPFLIFAVRRWGLAALGWAAAIAVVYQIVVALVVPPVWPDQFLWSATGIGRLMEMCAGMAAAVLVFRTPTRLSRAASALIAVVMVIAFVAAVHPALRGTVFPVRTVCLSIFFGGLILLVLRTPVLDRALAWAPLAFVGYRSYSLFLIHQPTVWFLSEFLQKVLGVPTGIPLLILLWTVGFLVVLGIGQIFFLLIEKPSIAWAKRAPGPGDKVGLQRVE